MTELLPHFRLYQKCKNDIKLDALNDPVLPKGAKLLAIQPAKTLSDEGGDYQSLPPPILLGKDLHENDDHREHLVQTLRWNLSAKLGILHSWMHVCLRD